MKKKRIFIAINLPKEVKEKLSSFKKKWPSLPCRWAPKENLHLTLSFLGYLKKEELKEVIKTTKKVASESEPFSISFKKVCYGPNNQLPPRLIWVEGKKSEQLSELKEKLENQLSKKIHIRKEKREFVPHITLARIKKWEWRRIEPDERPEVEQSLSLKIPVNSIEVMESKLKRSGAEYSVLKSFKL